MPAEAGKEEKISRLSEDRIQKTEDRKKNHKFLAFIVLVFIFDRISKIAALHYLSSSGVPVIPGIFHLTLVQNTGAAFGILKNEPKFLTGVSIAAVLAILFFLRRRSFPWALVIGGALGNLYDRLRYGTVIDFLDFRVWPVFNLADAAICVGVAWIVWDFFKSAAHSF